MSHQPTSLATTPVKTIPGHSKSSPKYAPISLVTTLSSLNLLPQDFTVQFHQNSPYESTFSLFPLDASIANAFRRILIAEIPTLAIEYVFIHNNTSIIQDEVLAARLGLVPLTGRLKGLNWMQFYKRPVSDEHDGGGGEEMERDTAADNNTVVLKLQKECSWAPGQPKEGETDPNVLYVNSNVYARDIEFVPTGRQFKEFPAPDGIIRPVNPDILLAKMRPGHIIDLEMHCVKGIGADHAKFSPVATASYRLLPTIDILQPIVGQEARKFARCFPKGVIGLEQEEEDEEVKAVVRDTMRDTVSRECLRHEEFKDKVKLGRVRDHFIFGVESTGQFESDLLFLESVKILKMKCVRLKRSLANVTR